MIEGDLDPDAGVQEVHLPLAEVVLPTCEQPRLRPPSLLVEPLSEESVDCSLPAGRDAPSLGGEALLSVDDVMALDPASDIEQFAPFRPKLKDLLGMSEVV
jgi:hypothetical protein